MPSLSSKDRVSLCRFTFDDGRRCRTPRVSTSPDFCFYHAQKEAQFRANEKLGEDLAYFFSGDYLSANDLNTALGRVFVAVARGDVKPRAARTLAYLAQTMLQTLHLAQNELISACGDSEWHDSVINSINANFKYRFPSSSQPDPPQAQAPPESPTPPPATATTCHPERSEGLRLVPASPVTADILPASQSAAEPSQATAQAPKPSAPPATSSQSIPSPRPPNPSRAVHCGPNDRLPIGVKPS
ncbi:MAG: hypothetical protein WB627_19720 [Candidatus Acidiferrum sp.]